MSKIKFAEIDLFSELLKIVFYTITLLFTFFIVKSYYHKKLSILFVNSLKYLSISIIY
mgnify:CR=1 FL=1